jgi:dATP pyrophosphohydrolase
MPRKPFETSVIPFRQNRQGIFEYAVFRRKDIAYWQAIAGGVEGDETPVDAAKREAHEEAGIPVSAKYYLLNTIASIPVYHFAARTHWPNDQYVVPGYYFAVEASNVDIVLSQEHTEYRWADYETATQLLHWDGDKTALWELNERLRSGDLPQQL